MERPLANRFQHIYFNEFLQLQTARELAAVFGLTHLSTSYYEAFWIRMGKECLIRE
jgi:hypothetical protein